MQATLRMELHASPGWILVSLIDLLACITCSNASLIASSEIQSCSRTSVNSEPMFPGGGACSKKFVVSLAVQSGQGESGAIYANIKHIEENVPNEGGQTVRKRQQLTKPFRIVVTKSDVYVAYPLKLQKTVVNHGPVEESFKWTVNVWVGAWRDVTDDNYCVQHELKKCPKYDQTNEDNGFCCEPSKAARWGEIFHYKRGHPGVGAESAEWTRTNVMAICAYNDANWWRVYDIGDPYLLYRINVTVQQLDYYKAEPKGEADGDGQGDTDEGQPSQPKEVWRTIGFTTIGPERMGDNTNRKKPGVTSGPEVLAEWQGDFASTSSFPALKTKYLLVPDQRISYQYYNNLFYRPHKMRRKRDANTAPKHDDYLLIEKHMFDLTGQSCNKIGVKDTTIVKQPNRCRQKTDSCFIFTPKTVLKTAKDMEQGGVKSHYLPTFYGEFRGFMQTNEGINLLYRSDQIHQSLVTLQFTATSISFIDQMSPGRIVEAVVEDFLALAGSSSLTVTVQNTGTITSAYSVSVEDCTDGIIPIAEKRKDIGPRQQETFLFEISSSLNMDFSHNCTVLLTNDDGKVLGSKVVNFDTSEGCVYCPDGMCDCDCKAKILGNLTAGVGCTADRIVKPIANSSVVYQSPCYHCWFTDTFKSPVKAAFTIMTFLMTLGMIKMLCCQCCCKTKDGRNIDVAGIILGTTNQEHTWKKQRSSTMHFLLGASFFLYLPLLPCVMLFCKWRRRVKARKRLQKKAERKKLRIMQKKRAALVAMKGLMVQEELTIEDALKVMEEGQKAPDRLAPMLPPKVLVVSSSSDTDKNDFNYTSSSEDIPENFLAAAKKKSPLLGPQKKGVAANRPVAGRAPKGKKGVKKRPARATQQPKSPISGTKTQEQSQQGKIGRKEEHDKPVQRAPKGKEPREVVDKRDKSRPPKRGKGLFEPSKSGKGKSGTSKFKASKGQSGRKRVSTKGHSGKDKGRSHKSGGQKAGSGMKGGHSGAGKGGHKEEEDYHKHGEDHKEETVPHKEDGSVKSVHSEDGKRSHHSHSIKSIHSHSSQSIKLKSHSSKHSSLGSSKKTHSTHSSRSHISSKGSSKSSHSSHSHSSHSHSSNSSHSDKHSSHSSHDSHSGEESHSTHSEDEDSHSGNTSDDHEDHESENEDEEIDNNETEEEDGEDESEEEEEDESEEEEEDKSEEEEEEIEDDESEHDDDHDEHSDHDDSEHSDHSHTDDNSEHHSHSEDSDHHSNHSDHSDHSHSSPDSLPIHEHEDSFSDEDEHNH